VDQRTCKLIAYRLHTENNFLKIVPAPADRFWMDYTTKGWANRCLPLRVANQAGWHVLSDCDFEVEWTGRLQVHDVKIRFRPGQSSRHVRSNFGYGIVTWHLPYLFRTSPGYNLLVRGPANMPKDGIAPLEGLVETDWSNANFTMNWKITRPGRKIKFAKDEPVCLLLPQRRNELEGFEPAIRNLESEPEVLKGFGAWDQSRKAFVAEMSKRTPRSDTVAPWQGHYTRGAHITGEAAQEHQTKLALQPFAEDEPPLRQPSPTDRTPPISKWGRIRATLLGFGR
jgi:hypothetical protein